MVRQGRVQDLLIPLIAVATLPLGTLALFFLSFEAALVIFVLGWFLLTPVLAILGEELDFGSDEGTETSPQPDPIDRLRDRYASGEIDEAELERRLDALLEIEDLDANDEEAIERAVERIDTRGTATADTTVERESE